VTPAKKDILQGWKDIASYVSRDVRTVKRWEKQRGLPVRRMPGEGRANVYALIPELDSWLSNTTVVEHEEDLLAASQDDSEEDAEVTKEPSTAVCADEFSAPLIHSHQRRQWPIVAAFILFFAALAAVPFVLRAHRATTQSAVDLPPFNPTQTAREVKYNSKQPGVDALYLRGIYFYEQRTPETLNHALQCFQQAVDKDPGYGPAYAGLAQTYNLIREYSVMPEAEAYAKAKTAAQRAIALDPHLSDAHASLGFVEFFYDWNATGAEREFHTAISLDPSSALAHHWYASMLTHQARFSESLAQLDIAQRLQPTSISILSDRAFALALSGHRNEAADLLQEIVNEDPNSPSPHRTLGNISMLEPRDIPRNLYEIRRFATLRHDAAGLKLLDELELAFRAGGATAMWRALLAEEERNHPSPDDRTYAMAEAEAALGQNEASLHDLNQLLAKHNLSLSGLAIDTLLTSLHGDPRFSAIEIAVGLPPSPPK